MEEIKHIAKPNCKSCLGRGFVTRTIPTGKKGKKEMAKNKTLCHCATEIKTPGPDECVVPKVANDRHKEIQYAHNAIPIPN